MLPSRKLCFLVFFVFLPTATAPPNKPTLTGYDDTKSYEVGEELDMKCAVDGRQPNVIKVIFQCPGRPDQPDSLEGGMVVSRLTFKLQESDNHKECVCFAANGVLESEKLTSVLNVRVTADKNEEGSFGWIAGIIVPSALIAIIVLTVRGIQKRRLQKHYSAHRGQETTKASTSQSDTYNMNHSRRGLAVIFNIKEFDAKTKMKTQKRTDKGCRDLDVILTKIGFTVEVFNDVTSQKMEQIMKKVGETDHTDEDCFACVILSHGDEGVIYGRDGPIEVEKLLAPVKRRQCPSLAGKPKLFFIQAGREKNKDDGVGVDGACGDTQTDGGKAEIQRIPTEADFLVFFAALPGDCSLHAEWSGSPFVQELIDVLNEYWYEWLKVVDLLSMMTRVCKKVACQTEIRSTEEKSLKQKKQMPCIMSMLTREIFFTPHIAPLQTQKVLGNYSMNHKKRGLAVIFNIKKFDAKTKMKNPKGTDLGRQDLYNILNMIGFKVLVFDNVTSQKMEQVMKEVGKTDHTDEDCFACVILSHGDEGVIYGRDGPIEVERLLAPVKKRQCPSLAGKPKLFFIQACRGNKLDEGMEGNDAHCETQTDGKTVKIQRILAEADFLMAYTVVPGYVSFSCPETGPPFVRTLAEVLRENWRQMDLLSMTTRVCRKVAYEFESSNSEDESLDRSKQMPCIISMLTSPVIFTPKD